MTYRNQNKCLMEKNGNSFYFFIYYFKMLVIYKYVSKYSVDTVEVMIKK